MQRLIKFHFEVLMLEATTFMKVSILESRSFAGAFVLAFGYYIIATYTCKFYSSFKGSQFFL